MKTNINSISIIKVKYENPSISPHPIHNSPVALIDVLVFLILLCSSQPPLRSLASAAASEMEHSTDFVDSTAQGSPQTVHLTRSSADCSKMITQNDTGDLPDDFACDISQNVADGPTQPKLKNYPRTKFGTFTRSFSHHWFQKYPLLEYSVSRDAIYCFVCRHFMHRVSTDSPFVSGLRDWKNMDIKVLKHNSSNAHSDAVAKWSAQKQTDASGGVMECFSEDGNRRKVISRNRIALGTLIRASVFCARQAIGLRGHREHPKKSDNIIDDSESDEERETDCLDSKGYGSSKTAVAVDEVTDALSKTNRGNFLEVLELLKMESGDIRQNLDKLPGNAQYTSKNAQEDFVKVAADEVRRAIIHEIVQDRADEKLATMPTVGLFACIVDEARDNSCTEMMSICVRYVHKTEIKERFLGFVRLTKLDAVSLAKELSSFLTSVGLSMNMCVAQSYDGASVMSGRVRGVQQLIRQIAGNPCPYVHCHAHRLNLAIVDVAKDVDGVGDTFGLLEAIYAFQSVSTIRNAEFLAAQENIYIGERVLKMPQQSDTRWVCKFVGVQYFQKRFASVMKALDDFSKSSNKKEAAEARGLLIQFKSFDVVFFLNMFVELLGITNCLSVSLQSVALDMGTCQRLIDGVIKTLTDKRTDDAFEIMWAKAEKFASDIGLKNPNQDSKRPVRVSAALADSIVMCPIGHRGRDNYRCDKESFRVRYYEVLDTVVSEMVRRFGESDEVLNALCAFDPTSPCLLSSELLLELAHSFQALLKLNTDHLESQIQVARNMLLQTRPKTTLLMYAQLSAMSCAFPDLLALFKLALTVPVASASAERSFSAMRRIKTYLRASMSANRTSDLTVLSVERQLSSRIMEDPSSTITAFAHMRKRRIPLV